MLHLMSPCDIQDVVQQKHKRSLCLHRMQPRETSSQVQLNAYPTYSTWSDWQVMAHSASTINNKMLSQCVVCQIVVPTMTGV